MIAAGEVVERPAGIVKECVENSIDAGATVIEVEVFQGGIERIVITDDGCGMDHEDAHLAFMRHATSKMHSEEELFNIQTMGFRGEALPSIASVAQVELQTSNGEEGTLLRYNYGSLDVDEKCNCPRGTKLDVSGLFIKTPARFKHLKSTSYEFSVIADLMNKMALSHPDIRFQLSHDGVERYFAYPYADEELATMRNVAGEIKGSEAAMRFAKENGYKKLAIHYDYEGIQKWCTGEWAAKKEGTQAYQRIYEEMKQHVQIKFVKVKGHSNDKYNDYADMLAKSALGIGDGSFEKKENVQW